MAVKRFAEAKPYESPNHWDCKALRLQGFEDGGPKKFWVGMSHFLPGGGAGPDSSPLEKVYVIVAGEMTLEMDGKSTVLKANDSCCIPPGKERKIFNAGNDVASMMVVMPYPEG
jgi:mannose-6-phosphate isomerase-like protein (cupin superfamily)